jgi:hypothetical protein
MAEDNEILSQKRENVLKEGKKNENWKTFVLERVKLQGKTSFSQLCLQMRNHNLASQGPIIQKKEVSTPHS